MEFFSSVVQILHNQRFEAHVAHYTEALCKAGFAAQLHEYLETSSVSKVMQCSKIKVRYVVCKMRYDHIWVFPKIGVPQNGWFIMENPIKMDDLGVPVFSETSICTNYACANAFTTKEGSPPAWNVGYRRTGSSGRLYKPINLTSGEMLQYASCVLCFTKSYLVHHIFIETNNLCLTSLLSASLLPPPLSLPVLALSRPLYAVPH